MDVVLHTVIIIAMKSTIKLSVPVTRNPQSYKTPALKSYYRYTAVPEQ
jgi:hypothetical protein